MTDPHEQVFLEVQRCHITALSREVQRCRLAAIWKLEEGMDGRAGSSVEFDAAKTPKGGHQCEWSLVR